MKINRLFGILYVLLNRRKVKAQELADHFEVSVRTIYRDVDTLCEAGIPLYALQGKCGGIVLDQDFVLDRSLFTPQEQSQILMAMQNFNIADFSKLESTIEKLAGIF